MILVVPANSEYSIILILHLRKPTKDEMQKKGSPNVLFSAKTTPHFASAEQVKSRSKTSSEKSMFSAVNSN